MSQETEAPPVVLQTQSGLVRFGVYELDVASGELRKAGSLIKLRQQPARVLAFLAQRPGQLVTREELRSDLWGVDTWVDFDQGLNYCIKEIRAALGDSAETPLFVETLPRRGYRFIAPVAPSPDRAVPPVDAAPARVDGAHPSAWLAGLVVLSVAAMALAWFLTRRPGAAPVPDWQRITFRRGALTGARFGRGGELVLSAAWDGRRPALFTAIPGSPEARELPIADARLVGVSSRGEVAFLVGGPGPAVLSRAPIAGGPTKPVLERVQDADMSADGETFAVAHLVPGQGTLIEYPIGRVLRPANRPTHLRISPDGRWLAFLEHPKDADDRGFAVVLSAEGQQAAVSPEFPSIEGLAWSPGSDAVLLTASKSGSASGLFSMDRTGRMQSVLPASGRLVVHDVAADGRMLLERSTVRGEVGLMGDDGERDLSWFDNTTGSAVSGDGAHVLLTESGDAGGTGYGVYVRAIDGTDPVRVGAGVGTGLSADGRLALAIPVIERDHIDILPTGAGEARALRHTGIVQYQWAAFTPDGTRVVFTGGERGHNLRVFVGDLTGGTPRPLTPDGLILTHDTISPDGRVVVAPCRPLNWCLYPLDGSAPTPVPGIAGLNPVAFAPEGHALIVRPRVGSLPLRLERLDLATGARVPWREVAPRDPVGVSGIGGITMSRDRRVLVASYTRRLSELYLMPGPPSASVTR